MNDADSKRIGDFLHKWLGSEENERANYQTFFGDMCVALEVAEPPPKGSVEGDKYCFVNGGRAVETAAYDAKSAYAD